MKDDNNNVWVVSSNFSQLDKIFIELNKVPQPVKEDELIKD